MRVIIILLNVLKTCLKTKRDKTLVLTKPELMVAHPFVCLTRINFLYSK